MPRSQAAKHKRYNCCSMHPDHFEDIFCAIHNILICSLCHLFDHQNCSVRTVEETCKYIPISKINTLYDTVYSLKTMIVTRTRKLEDERTAMINEAERLFDDITAKVNTLYQDTLNEVEASYKAQLALLSDNKTALNSVIVSLENCFTDTEAIKCQTIDTKKFLKAQNAVNIASDCIKDLKDVNQSLCFNSLSFVPDKSIEKFLSTACTFGTVSESKINANIDLTFPEIIFPECLLQPLSHATGKPDSNQKSKPFSLGNKRQLRPSQQSPDSGVANTELYICTQIQESS